ncbi:MAG TPA: SPFH domain-containing protein [Planctomycetota bacterium]|nr:SPFH domain-containing protein [Planctomycetota bacterium]
MRLLRGLGSAAVIAVLFLARAVARFAAWRPVRSTVRVVTAAVVIAALVLGVGATCLVRIPPGTIGVRQFEFGGRGLAERDHAPGIAFSLPLLESWHRLDGTTQVLAFGWESEGGDFPVLDLRTREGTVVKVGAAIVHRIRSGEAWQIVRDGQKMTWPRRVRTAAEDELARAVARLSAAELCDSDVRARCAGEVAEALDRELAPDHVTVERVLLTQVWFGPVHEKKLQAKQLLAQQELLQRAAGDVEAQRSRLAIREQEIENGLAARASDWDRRIAERTAQGRSEIAALQSATKTYDRTHRAKAQADHARLVLEGDQLVARSESLKEGLMRKALATAGGRLWLAREAAENLNIRQVTLNSNDPSVPSVIDLDAIVKLLIGAQGSTKP